MQDLETGEMIPLDPARMKLVEELSGEIDRQDKAFAKAKDAAIPDRTRQGPVFSVGEELMIKGGRFKVHAISGKRLYLDSLPGK